MAVPATDLQGRFEGDVLSPEDPRYEDARAIFNSMIERRPALIAQCASVAGASLTDDGLVIDMRRLNAVSVDFEARTATVAGGAVWADVDRACQPHGLFTVGGRVSTAGVAARSTRSRPARRERSR